jgi:uncharacterized protein YqeY
MLFEKIQKDQIEAMKSRENGKLQTLRYILSQIKNEQIEKRRELSDEEIVSIIRKEVKKLQDASSQFREGNREDLAKENDGQIQIISTYLPQELSDENLKEKVMELIKSNEAVFNKNKNAFIGIAISKLKDQASSSRIAETVKALS